MNSRCHPSVVHICRRPLRIRYKTPLIDFGYEGLEITIKLYTRAVLHHAGKSIFLFILILWKAPFSGSFLTIGLLPDIGWTLYYAIY